MSERPVDIWNKMVRGARVTGRCMFCESEIFPSYKNKRPVICIDDGCRKTYHRIYRHLVRNPRERRLPKDQQERLRLSRNERARVNYGIRRRRDGDAGVR
jgi:hypothetical protein